MTEAQYKKADSKVLPVSLIIIIGIFLNMIGLIASQGGNIQLYITAAACVVGALVNIFTYIKTKGTKKCGIIMIIAALVVCCVMVVFIDTVGYYMIPMATVVMSMAYMYMTITMACGISTMVFVITKIVLLAMSGKVSAIEGGTTVFIMLFILAARTP